MLEETVSDATTFSRDGVIAMSFYTLSFQKLPDLTETLCQSLYEAFQGPLQCFMTVSKSSSKY